MKCYYSDESSLAALSFGAYYKLYKVVVTSESVVEFLNRNLLDKSFLKVLFYGAVIMLHIQVGSHKFQTESVNEIL